MADNLFSQAPMSSYYGFGINPAYTTPAYMSNFRPAYASDTDPFNPYSQNRGYFEALRGQYLFNPVGTYASDPSEDERANNWAINTMHSDALVNGVTKIGVPLAAWYGANKFFGMKVAARSPTSGLWDRGAAYAGAIYRGQGMGAASAAWSSVAARQSLGAAAGSVLGRGAGRFAGGVIGGAGRMVGLGGALRGASGLLGGAGAVAGGLVGSIAAPIAAGMALGSAANTYIADPYVGLRRGEDAMLANTANQFVGGDAAPNMGAFGVSATHANKLSRAFMDSNIRDMGFKPGDYSAIADYGMQAGIFNDIGNMNVDQMKKRVEGMADSVKMIMAVANTNSVKEAIQYMARLKAAGVSNPGAVTRVMSEMGLASGISGSSAEQIMNTVGNQGQMIAQRLGILPIMGQRQAASIYAGFANAYKTGALHSADVAALGGVEGATQYVMEGAGRVMNSSYFRAAINSGVPLGTGTPLNVTQAYGQRRAQDPLGSIALDTLNGGVNTSEYLNKHSMTSMITNYAYDRAKNIPAARGANGKVDILKALYLLVSNGELSQEEYRAIAEQVKMLQSPEYVRRLESAATGTANKQIDQWMSQEGYDTLSGIPGVGRMWQEARETHRDVMSGSAGVSGAFTSLRAGMADGWDSFQAKIQGRRRMKDIPVAGFTMENGKQTRTELDIGSYVSFMGVESRSTEYDGILRELSKDIMNEDPTSELGQLALKLQANLGKKTDNRADLNEYYRLKKGNVGKTGLTPYQFAEQGNTAIQTGKQKITKVTVDDLNPRLDAAFTSAYAEGVSGSDDPGNLKKKYWNSSNYKGLSRFDKMFNYQEGFAKYVTQGFNKGDGARVFNAAVRSMRNTGAGELSDIFDPGGDGKTSYFSEEFGKLLAAYQADPSSLSAEDRSRVEEYLAMKNVTGWNKDALDSIDKSILAYGRGDRAAAGDLFGQKGDDFRKAAVQGINNTFKNMNPEMLRSGMKFAMVSAGYTGVDMDPLNFRTDTSLRSMTLDGTARYLKKGYDITGAATDEISRARQEAEDYRGKFEGIEGFKSYGVIADNIGKASSDLSGSAKDLTDAAEALTKAAGAGNPKLISVLENLNKTITPLIKAQTLPGVSTNYGGQR